MQNSESMEALKIRLQEAEEKILYYQQLEKFRWYKAELEYFKLECNKFLIQGEVKICTFGLNQDEIGRCETYLQHLNTFLQVKKREVARKLLKLESLMQDLGKSFWEFENTSLPCDEVEFSILETRIRDFLGLPVI